MAYTKTLAELQEIDGGQTRGRDQRKTLDRRFVTGDQKKAGNNRRAERHLRAVEKRDHADAEQCRRGAVSQVNDFSDIERLHKTGVISGPEGLAQNALQAAVEPADADRRVVDHRQHQHEDAKSLRTERRADRSEPE